MNTLHSLLKRQLKRFADQSIPLLEEQADFIRAINDAYWQFDADRKMLEHSLELTSQELLERNTELDTINSDLEKRVETRTAQLSASEARFRGLFEHAPIALWEEDFSSVRQYLDDLRAVGIVDFSTYFELCPEEVAKCAARVKILDVNRATLEMFQAESKAELLADLSKILGPESLIAFKEELLALLRGDQLFEIEIINYTLKQDKRSVFLRLTIAPGYEQTWAKVFVGLSDVTERRKVEAALAAERDLLQALMDNIPDTIYFKDTSSRFTRVNKAQAFVLGVAKPEDAIGKTDLDFQDSQLAQSFLEEEQRLLQTGEPLFNRIEYNPTAAGQPRWFSASKVPIKNEAGRVTGMVGVSHDITKRKQVEEALRQSEERFKLMAWATKDAVWDWDLETNHIWWGEGLHKIFHYLPENADPTAEWRQDHIHSEDRGKVSRVIDQALNGGMEFWSKEYRFQRKDGTYADIMDRGYIIRDDAGKPYRMIGAMMDITDRKQAEQALAESEARYRQIVETAGDLIYWVDARGRLTYVNPTCLRIMGYKSEEEVLGRHFLEFVHPAWRERVRDTYKQQFFRKTVTTYFEFVAITRQRREIWLGQTVQVAMEENRVTGFQAVGRDITDQKDAESATQAANYKMGQLLTEVQRRNSEIVMVNELSRLLQSCQSAEQAYGIIADMASKMFPYTSGALYLLNPHGTEANTVGSWGELSRTNRTFSPDNCQAFRTGFADPLQLEQTRHGCIHISEPQPASTLCLPIYIQEEILGVLHVRSRDKVNLDEAKIQLAYTVVEQTGMALSNIKLREQLREQSIRDSLTGLFNRRYLEETLLQLDRRMARQRYPLGIIMIDIDYFKNFNDTHGHAAGDALLRTLGQFLQRRIRGEDIACRYGGEEFILIMPDASLEAVQKRAEEIRKEAKRIQVDVIGSSGVGVTLSLGVAVYPQHGYSIEEVLRAADSALYRAKLEGRDHVVVAETYVDYTAQS